MEGDKPVKLQITTGRDMFNALIAESEERSITMTALVNEIISNHINSNSGDTTYESAQDQTEQSSSAGQ